MRKNNIIIITWEKASAREKSLSKYFEWRLYNFKSKLKYLVPALYTLKLILKYKPRVIIIQLPQGPLLFWVVILKYLVRYKLVADMHSGFLIYDSWKGLLLNKPFIPFLKYSDLILVHNNNILSLLREEIRIKSRVVYDPIIRKRCKPKLGNYILLISTFSEDEDIRFVLEGYLSSQMKYPIYITGDYRKNISVYRDFHSYREIKFLGWISDDLYERYLAGARAIVTCTKREYTMQRAIWEAALYEKVILIPRTRTLENLVDKFAIFYDYNNLKSIKSAFNRLFSISEEELLKIGKKLNKYLIPKSYDSLNKFKKELSNLLKDKT